MTQLELIRRTQGLKQIELAEKIGLSNTYISLVERGWSRPSRNFKRKVSRVLRTSERILFPGEGNNGTGRKE